MDKKRLTSENGKPIADNIQTAGVRGPAMLQDVWYLEKLAHFDREVIPERRMHAKGSGAFGTFTVTHDITKYTRASIFSQVGKKTDCLVRFSTVAGERGAADAERDIRGFAMKFYTDTGNWDLVGNNTPVFFLRDPLKFPDLNHAIKRDPRTGMRSANNNWDFWTLLPEALHQVTITMSPRGIPASFRHMHGFGSHTFSFYDKDNKRTWVKFHFRTLQGIKNLTDAEAEAVIAKDRESNQRDLFEAIERGDYPRWLMQVQLMTEEEARNYKINPFDLTKVWYHGDFPLHDVGILELNRNPDNFFAETEQVAFCPANIVPGIDFSDDPLLQGRIFSYSDTQRHRLGGANFTEIPINRPICPFHNNQRDGFHRMQIDASPANYDPNSIGNNWPRETPPEKGGFTTSPQTVSGVKERLRSPSFAEYYSHPRLFWMSQTPVEQEHIINAFSFELGKVTRPYIRERVVDLLTRIDPDLASGVARNLGIQLTREQLSRELPRPVCGLEQDPSLSLYAHTDGNLKGLCVSLLAADGVSLKSVKEICEALHEEGIHPQIIAPHMGSVTTEEGEDLPVDGTLSGTPSVLFDSVIVPEGEQSIATLLKDGDAKYHLRQAYRHLKAIGLPGNAKAMLEAASLPQDMDDAGLLMPKDTKSLMLPFITAMKQHRVWSREPKTLDFGA